MLDRPLVEPVNLELQAMEVEIEDEVALQDPSRLVGEAAAAEVGMHGKRFEIGDSTALVHELVPHDAGTLPVDLDDQPTEALGSVLRALDLLHQAVAVLRTDRSEERLHLIVRDQREQKVDVACLCPSQPEESAVEGRHAVSVTRPPASRADLGVRDPDRGCRDRDRRDRPPRLDAREDASGEWQSSVRVQVREGAGEVNAALLVYDEALFGGRVAEARFRAEELRREAAETALETSAAVLAESTVLSALAEAFDSAGNPSAGEGTLNVRERLADLRRQRTRGMEPSPSALAEEGDRQDRRATWAAAAAVPGGVAFLLGALAQAFSRRRRLLVATGFVGLILAGSATTFLEVFTP